MRCSEQLRASRHLLPPPPFRPHAGAAPHSAVAELGVVRRLHTNLPVKALAISLPRSRQSWLHLIFCAFETFVLSMTVRDFIVRLPSMHGEHLSDQFYFVYLCAIALLAITSFLIRRSYCRLSIVGWITSVFAFLWCGIGMPVY